MPFLNGIQVSPVDARRWILMEELSYRGNTDIFDVPVGYVTDFATVPRVFTWLLPTFGDYTAAAILHDYLLTDLVAQEKLSSRDADGIFRRVCAELSVPPRRYWLMWAGVRLGALGSSRRKYQRQFHKDAFKVFGIVLLALPIVLPGVIGVSVGLALDSIVATLSGRTRDVWRT